MCDLEHGSANPIELGVEDHRIEVQPDLGARSFRHSEIVEDPTTRPTAPSLRIMKRQSLEQQTSVIGEVKAPTRRSIGSLLPGQWLGESGVKKMRPKR